MPERFSALRCKEVINVTDGCRLGYTEDLEIETESGRVLALIVPGPGKLFGLLPGSHEFVIPWGCIRRIGSDIILVDAEPEKCRRPKHRKRLFS